MWCKTVSRSTLERIISVASCSTAMSRMLDWISRKGRPQGEAELYDFSHPTLLGESRIATDGMLAAILTVKKDYGPPRREHRFGSERVYDAQCHYFAQ